MAGWSQRSRPPPGRLQDETDRKLFVGSLRAALLALQQAGKQTIILENVPTLRSIHLGAQRPGLCPFAGGSRNGLEFKQIQAWIPG